MSIKNFKKYFYEGPLGASEGLPSSGNYKEIIFKNPKEMLQKELW